MNWVLAATLICGASVFTSCSEGGDNPAPENSRDRKEFIEHSRQSLKTMAENLNFTTWNSVNYCRRPSADAGYPEAADRFL